MPLEEFEGKILNVNRTIRGINIDWINLTDSQVSWTLHCPCAHPPQSRVLPCLSITSHSLLQHRASSRSPVPYPPWTATHLPLPKLWIVQPKPQPPFHLSDTPDLADTTPGNLIQPFLLLTHPSQDVGWGALVLLRRIVRPIILPHCSRLRSRV